MVINYINKIFVNRISLILIFLLIYKLPITNPLHFIFFVLYLILIFSVISFKNKFKFKVLILFIITVSFSYFFEKKTIIENHAIFLPNAYNQELYLNENQEIYSLLIDDFYNSYSDNDLNCYNQKNRCWRDIKLDKIYSRSFDNLYFGKLQFSRKVNKINHK